MAHSKSTVAAIRFGYGLSGTGKGAGSARDLLASLRRVELDQSVTAKARLELNARMRKLRKDDSKKGKAQYDKLRKRRIKLIRADFQRGFFRAVENDTGFATRLTRFWADHFTIVGRNPRLSALAATHTEEAIRPNLNGRFGDMLVAAVTHPAMLIYLDQISSAGNNSLANKRRKRGLNENLAREILELHTMGVGADYAQKDVRQLAELLSGLSVGKRGRIFRDAMAEPGAETVLGKTYGQDDGLANIEAALNDIAMHPQTAAHLAGKLVRHFVSDRPNREQVAYVAEAYLKSGGDLGRCYAALLEHPASWAELGGKVKQPFDYLASSLRALELDSRALKSAKRLRKPQRLLRTLATMGQPYYKANGPDGWPEEASYWITPAGMAARIDWASLLASNFGQERDPRAFIDAVLADAATPKLRALAAGAEVKWEGVALVLASPDFNRR